MSTRVLPALTKVEFPALLLARMQILTMQSSRRTRGGGPADARNKNGRECFTGGDR
jgi:hypothetical protein